MVTVQSRTAPGPGPGQPGHRAQQWDVRRRQLPGRVLAERGPAGASLGVLDDLS